MATFVPGQRWISDTETERGLGTILTQDARTVTILYPASGETRIYRIQNSPLTRIQFEAGDTIESLDGWQMAVTQVEETAGLLHYVGVRIDTGEECALLESDLSSRIELNKPLDRMLAGKLDNLTNFALRYQTLLHCQKLQRFPYLGFSSARTNLIPHQLYIADEVAARFAPRVLLADEVGLGKTIEAGLIINQQLMSGQAGRVLILVPEPLVHQWFVEMLRRFNIRFSIYDRERCEQEDFVNPFEGEQLIISDLAFICGNGKYREHVLNAHWDLLVVDEAHHIEYVSDEQPDTPYGVVKLLSEKTEGIILLTATPEQMGVESHFARLSLLDPQRFFDFQVFLSEMEQYKPIAQAVAELTDLNMISPTNLEAIDSILQDDEKALLDRLLSSAKDADPSEKKKFISQLVDRHSVSRVMFRNTRQCIDGFPGRGAQGYPQSWPELYDIALQRLHIENIKDNGSDCSDVLLIKNELYPELAYQQFIQDGAADPWWQIDPRIEWLTHLFKLLKKEKLLIICAHAETAMDVENALRISSGAQVAVFHQHLSIVERDRAAAWFADPFGAQAMVCSEIGSEGRNFQFSHHLVLFDLPGHPDLLEQRIGRLDRIGQSEPVRVHVPFFENKAQHRLFQWYDLGLDAFNHPCPAASAIYSELEVQLKEQLISAEGDFESFIRHTQTVAQEQNKNLDEGRNRLFELMSEGQETGQKIADAILAEQDGMKVQKYLESLLQSFGVEFEDHSENALIIRPGNHMTIDVFPGIPSDGMIACFDRDTALSREDMQFVSFGHPVIREGMDILLTGEIGNTAMGLLLPKTVRKENAQINGFIMEAIFVIEVACDPKLRLQRFLPSTAIRVLVDQNLKNFADKVPFDALNQQLSKVPSSLARKFIRARQDEMTRMAKKAEVYACDQARLISDQATQSLMDHITCAIQRLAALKKVNANVRDEELLFLKKQATEGQEQIHNAVLRLDGLRLILTAR